MTHSTGGCLCGTVRFALDSAPFDAGWCHCRTCQKSSGAPAMVFASVAIADYRFTAGEESVGMVASSGFGRRAFCTKCGTPLYMRVDHQPETIDLSVTTLDDPGAVQPGFHIFWASRVPWFDPGDDLPRYDRFRPDTRGLEGTEPPSR